MPEARRRAACSARPVQAARRLPRRWKRIILIGIGDGPFGGPFEGLAARDGHADVTAAAEANEVWRIVPRRLRLAEEAANRRRVAAGCPAMLRSCVVASTAVRAPELLTQCGWRFGIVSLRFGQRIGKFFINDQGIAESSFHNTQHGVALLVGMRKQNDPAFIALR